MIELTRLDHSPLVVNCAHITCVEAAGDTLVTLTTGEKLLVRESVAEVTDRATAYLRLLGAGPALWAAAPLARTAPGDAPGPPAPATG